MSLEIPIGTIVAVHRDFSHLVDTAVWQLCDGSTVTFYDSVQRAVPILTDHIFLRTDFSTTGKSGTPTMTTSHLPPHDHAVSPPTINGPHTHASATMSGSPSTSLGNTFVHGHPANLQSLTASIPQYTTLRYGSSGPNIIMRGSKGVDFPNGSNVIASQGSALYTDSSHYHNVSHRHSLVANNLAMSYEGSSAAWYPTYFNVFFYIKYDKKV